MTVLVEGVARSYNKDTNGVLVDEECRVGLEMEMENMTSSVRLNPNLWEPVADGSLRDHGVEYITPYAQVLFGQDLVDACTELPVETKRNNKPSLSDRCGFHVHLDITGKEAHEVLGVVILYTIVERLLLRYCGEDRATNNYCVPMYNSDTLIKYINQLKTGITRGHIHSAMGRMCKYTALNLKCLFDKGTLEFRSHRATLNTGDMLFWINTLLSIRKYGINNDAASIVNDFIADPMAMLRTVFREDILDRLITPDDAMSDNMYFLLLEGIETSKNILNYHEYADFRRLVGEEVTNKESLWSTISDRLGSRMVRGNMRQEESEDEEGEEDDIEEIRAFVPPSPTLRRRGTPIPPPQVRGVTTTEFTMDLQQHREAIERIMMQQQERGEG